MEPSLVGTSASLSKPEPKTSPGHFDFFGYHLNSQLSANDLVAVEPLHQIEDENLKQNLRTFLELHKSGSEDGQFFESLDKKQVDKMVLNLQSSLI